MSKRSLTTEQEEIFYCIREAILRWLTQKKINLSHQEIQNGNGDNDGEYLFKEVYKKISKEWEKKILPRTLIEEIGFEDSTQIFEELIPMVDEILGRTICLEEDGYEFECVKDIILTYVPDEVFNEE